MFDMLGLLMFDASTVSPAVLESHVDVFTRANSGNKIPSEAEKLFCQTVSGEVSACHVNV